MMQCQENPGRKKQVQSDGITLQDIFRKSLSDGDAVYWHAVDVWMSVCAAGI